MIMPPDDLAGPASAQRPFDERRLVPSSDLTFSDLLRFRRGKSIFDKDWSVTAKANVALRNGPANAVSCVACHGIDSPSPQAQPLGRIVLFAVAEQKDVLHALRVANRLGTIGRVSEAVRQAGMPCCLTRPNFVDPRHGSEFFGRRATTIEGLGLLEAIPESDIKSWHRDHKLGRISYPRDKGLAVIGRFGWKSEFRTVDEIVRHAAAHELGLSTAALGDDEIRDLIYYSKEIAVLTRVQVPDRHRKGYSVFQTAGCASCHRPSYRVTRTSFGRPTEMQIWPFTDLLLHDMGEDMRGPTMVGQTDAEWRTAPLWGIGRRLQRKEGLLHDGRARDVREAIAWHGGEGEPSRRTFMKLQKEEAKDLIEFIGSL